MRLVRWNPWLKHLTNVTVCIQNIHQVRLHCLSICIDSQSVLSVRQYCLSICINSQFVLSARQYCLSICIDSQSVLSVYLYCQCQPILPFLLNGLSVRLSCLMCDNLSCLVSMFYLIVCLSVFSMSVCLYCQCQSNYYFLPKWHVCLSVLSVYLHF